MLTDRTTLLASDHCPILAGVAFCKFLKTFGDKLCFKIKRQTFFLSHKNEIKKTVTTKSAGFYVGAAAMLITIAQAVLYAAFFKQTAFSIRLPSFCR